MRGTVRRALLLLAIFLAVAFAVLLVNQTAQLVELVARIHPVAGDATLWGLIFIYAGCLAVPIIMLLRLPAPLRPPASEEDPAFDQHLEALRMRLERNPRVADSTLESKAEIEAALEELDKGVDEEIKDTGSRVFMTTAISQNGSLDALVVH